MSDFLPTYLTPNGTDTITPAMNEKVSIQNRKTNLSNPVNIVMYGINGIDVRKHKARADALPNIILSFSTGICLIIHIVFSSFKNRFKDGNTAVYIITT